MFDLKSKTLIVSLLMVSVILAGCVSDDTGPTAGTDGDTTESNEPVDLGNNGAIRGLVVDDNFRPVQLKEE